MRTVLLYYIQSRISKVLYFCQYVKYYIQHISIFFQFKIMERVQGRASTTAKKDEVSNYRNTTVVLKTMMYYNYLSWVAMISHFLHMVQYFINNISDSWYSKKMQGRQRNQKQLQEFGMKFPNIVVAVLLNENCTTILHSEQ